MSRKRMADCGSWVTATGTFPAKEFDKEYDGVSDVSLLIGPEGDFSPTEVAAVVEAGFIPVTFGNTRLRTETAALYALCATHSAINRLHQ